MLNVLWRCFCSLFTKDSIGILTKVIFTTTTSIFVKDLMDKKNQKIAYEIVMSLNDRSDISNTEKAKMFNEIMIMWCVKEGRKISTSVINALRELAVNAIKIERGH